MAEGSPEVAILAYGEDRRSTENVWHSDMTWRAEQPFASLLPAQSLPPSGGDTLRASMYAAYDALPDKLKAILPDLHAVHGISPEYRREVLESTQGVQALHRVEAAMGPVRHPLVRRHRVTGRPVVFVNRSFTWHIEGLRAHLSRSLLEMLFDHIAQPEFQVRFRWLEHALAFWDNRSAQQYAVSDYFPSPRHMHRITLVTDRRAAR